MGKNCANYSKLAQADLSGLGDGKANTLVIVEACPGDNAANACNDLGWYLPSRDEMDKLFFNHLLLDNFDATATYWTSTIYPQTNDDAYNSGSTSAFTTAHFVRPIKKF